MVYQEKDVILEGLLVLGAMVLGAMVLSYAAGADWVARKFRFTEWPK